MFARKVVIKLKPQSALDFSRHYDQHVLPVLRRQPGFRDGITLVSGERAEALALSFWDRPESAEAFGRTSYPSLLLGLAPFLAEPPEVSTLVVTNATSHDLAIRA